MTFTEILSDIAKAIQEVKGDNTPIKAEDFASEIRKLSLNQGSGNMTTIQIPINFSGYYSSGSFSLNGLTYDIYTDNNDPEYTGRIAGYSYEDLYEGWKNGTINIKLYNTGDNMGLGTEVFNVAAVTYYEDNYTQNNRSYMKKELAIIPTLSVVADARISENCSGDYYIESNYQIVPPYSTSYMIKLTFDTNGDNRTNRLSPAPRNETAIMK